MTSELSAHEIGDGLPVLIIHGWQGDGRVEELDFEPIFSQILGLRRIYIDLPGMGKTPANNVKDLDDMYHRLEQFIDSRLRGSRFVLIGTSCGGYLARAIAQKYSDQIDGLLLRVPLIEPDDNKRDLDAFQALVRDQQIMSSISAEDKETLGDILVQTPAYVAALKAKFEKAYLPAQAASDTKVLGPIRNDLQRYSLSWSLDDKDVKFPCTDTHYRGTHGIPVDENGVFEALVRDWTTRINEWRARSVD
ncbi:hypothetical protein N7470_001539 [Penicillium chermesinum]|nr:hypothetical protein N7470_001539 [Penicillium chermesinum]